MLLSEIRDRVLLEAGNIFLADLSLIGVQPSQFLTLVRNTLDYWTGYCYDHRTIVAAGDSLGRIDLTQYVENGMLPRLPITVSDVVGISNSAYFDQATKVYQYDKPVIKLLTAFSANCKITLELEWVMTQVSPNDKKISQQSASTGSTSVPRLGGWNPNEIYAFPAPRDPEPYAPEDELTMWEIKNLEKSEKVMDFINLCTGKFMIALGRSRRAFTLNELPFQMDTAEMVGEGQELWDNTVVRMEETSDCFMNLLETPRTSGVW